jgi:hypothetical protein
VDLNVADGKLVIRVEGLDKLWALKSCLEIPLEHVAGVLADPEAARGWWHGCRNEYSGGNHRGHISSARRSGFLGCTQPGEDGGDFAEG